MPDPFTGGEAEIWDATERCMCRSDSRYAFMRTWFCSLATGHSSQHRAYENHDLTGEVAWEGPWKESCNTYASYGEKLYHDAVKSEQTVRELIVALQNEVRFP